MPRKGIYKSIPRMITPEEKTFIKLVGSGMNRTKAFKLAYPNHPTVQKHMDAIKKKLPLEERTRWRMSVSQLAKDKIQTKHMQSAMVTYQNKMNEFSNKAIDTAIDLVENARSEKVRADLAIEGIRHQVGSPVQKMQVQQNQDIVITFGDKHPDDVIDVDSVQEADTIK